MEMNVIHQFNLVLGCIREIPAFDGTDPNQLPDFLAQVEALLPSINLFQQNNINILLGYIKNKCVGATREALHRQGTISNWQELKEVLLNNFGEKETSRELMDKLKTWRMDSTIEKYHYAINKLRNKLHNRRLTHGDEGFTTDEINRISLQVFKDHLPEPTKTMIFARNPGTLEAAFKIILEARHQGYTSYGFNKKSEKPSSSFRTNFSDNVNNNHPRNNNSNRKNGNNNRNNNHNGNNRNNNNNGGNFNNNNRNNNTNGGNFENNNRNNNNNDNSYENNRNNGNNNRYNDNNSGNYNNGNNRQQNYQNSSNSRRQSNQSRNPNNSNRNYAEPMEIGSSNVNFRQDEENSFPI